MLPEFIRVSAGFLVKDKKVLVAQRKKEGDLGLMWEFPGGKCDGEEKFDEALIREFKEEFQIDIKVLKEIGGAEAMFKDKALIVVFLLIEADDSKMKLLHHEQVKFVSFTELKTIDLCEADKSFITKYEAELKEYID